MKTETNELIAIATKNIHDTVTIALEHTASQHAVIIYDTECALSSILVEAYKKALPDAEYVDFNTYTKDAIIAIFDALKPRDLVVLIQSTDFRLNEFRIRIQLFQRKLKVIDHQHLIRHTEDTWRTYINTLAYDPEWYRKVGPKLKEILTHTDTIRIVSEECELIVTQGVEEPKLNIGDYTGMENIGGTFPIGEVFMEAKDLSKASGSLMIYAFADTKFYTQMYEPFRIDITDGLVSGWGNNTPKAFADVIANINTNERAIMREIGFGLNRAITREKYLHDITAFERILGLHISLGEKHTVYKKQGITPDKTRFHVDLFPVVDTVYADEHIIFDGNTYTI